MLGRDVADQLLNDDRLTHAGAAVGADLAAAGEWADQVDDLDAGLEDRRLTALLVVTGRRAVDRPAVGRLRHVAEVVERFAEHVEETTEGALTDGHGDPLAMVAGRVAALHAVCAVHREAARAVVAEVLLHLGDDADAATHRDRDRVEERGQPIGRELHIDHCADDLYDVSVSHYDLH